MRLKILCMLFLCNSYAFATGMPVVDVANGLQNATIIAHQIDQIKTQVDQYKNQILQYENMLENTKSLTSFQWDDASNVIDNLLDVTNTLDSYKQEAGSLQAYLKRYQSQEYYQKSTCFNGHGQCSAEELNKINKNQMAASVAQKRANDAMLKGIDRQQQDLKKDAQALKELQTHAQNAEGQKQALQAASQLSSNQAHQLLQIRGLLVAGQNAQATKDAAAANKQAIQEAGDARFRAGTYHKSSGKKW